MEWIVTDSLLKFLNILINEVDIMPAPVVNTKGYVRYCIIIHRTSCLRAPLYHPYSQSGIQFHATSLIFIT